MRELVIPACRMVGRPIFFSVMIILISFLPVFSLYGMEGKTFHPLAFTKSFAMIGVADSVDHAGAGPDPHVHPRTVAAARKKAGWSARMIDIYKPVLIWALPRWNLVLWAFAVLLILGAGLFPLQAVFGIEWKTGVPGDVGGRHAAHDRVHAAAAPQLAGLLEPDGNRLLGLRIQQDRRRVHASARRREHHGHADHRSPRLGRRKGPTISRFATPSCAAFPKSKWLWAKTAEPRRRPTRLPST